jgi:hypothetical protein
MPRGTHVLKAPWLSPAVIAGAALIAVLSMLDPTGDHPGGWDGPGLTVDEPFNVIQGVQLVDRLLAGDLAGLRAVDARLPDHPPLGRLWIGICHEMAFVISPPIGTTTPYSFTCARSAPALAFAAVVFLVGWFTNRWFGGWSGGLASLGVVLMPRTFGHAHIASLESGINLAYVAVVLYLADRWGSPAAKAILPAPNASDSRRQPMLSLPTWRSAIIGGILFGLALLTKIQAVLLPIPVTIWALLVWRKRAIGLIPIWGLVGGLVFFAGWPYLWDSPLPHIQQYLGRTTERAVIYAWYGGRSIADREIPWHYPWVIWGTTIPIGLHFLGACGLGSSLRHEGRGTRAWLILACLAFPLFVFSIPGIAVYDGELLFSVSFPLWGVFVGVGGEWLRERLASRLPVKFSGAVVGGMMATQACGLIVMAPCWLSYYNALAGGLRGAEQKGLPVSYWGDGVLTELTDEVAKHVEWRAKIAVAPVLHPEQWNQIGRQSPILSERQIQFIPLGSQESADCELLLFFCRPEYLPEEYRGVLDEKRIVAAVRREGVILAALYRIR